MMNIRTNEDLQRIADRLYRLIDDNAAQALIEARQLRVNGEMRLSAQSLRAAILIDGGGKCTDLFAVREGLKILRRLVSKDFKNLGLRYNLANGLSQLAKLEPYSDPEWYVTTRAERREARSLYLQVVNLTKSSDLKAQSLINLGNELDSGYRWVEAYDTWVCALQVDPANSVAALSCARMLLRRARYHKQLPFSDTRAAGYYARLAKRQSAGIEKFAGADAAKLAKSLPTFNSSWSPSPIHRIKDDFARFVARHRLALVGTVEGLDLRKKRWDNVHIPSVLETLNVRSGIPAVFAMFNQLKADFCTARWLTYNFVKGTIKDTSLYMDTLDYALYGTAPSILILGQRAALDILDRVAVCANEYLATGQKPNEIQFRTFWREHDGAGTWKSWLKAEISTNNPGIIALGELASDLTEGGPLSPKHSMRNVSTHRFCVLHDLANTPSRESQGIEHHDIQFFFDHTIETLQIARLAILYLLDVIAWRESCNRTNGLQSTMVVMPHHYIRGEK